MTPGKKTQSAATNDAARSLAEQLHGDQWRSDLELVQRACRGDAEARDTLVHRMVCIPRILETFDAQRPARLGPEILEDAAQSATLRILRDLGEFTGSSRLETWFWGYANNAYREQLREHATTASRTVTGSAASRLLLEGSRDVTPVAAEIADQDELMDLWDQLQHLEPELQRVVVLRLREDLTFAQIAKEEELEVSGAKSRYYRALDQLKDHLARRRARFARRTSLPDASTTKGEPR